MAQWRGLCKLRSVSEGASRAGCTERVLIPALQRMFLSSATVADYHLLLHVSRPVVCRCHGQSIRYLGDLVHSVLQADCRKVARTAQLCAPSAHPTASACLDEDVRHGYVSWQAHCSHLTNNRHYSHAAYRIREHCADAGGVGGAHVAAHVPLGVCQEGACPSQSCSARCSQLGCHHSRLCLWSMSCSYA